MLKLLLAMIIAIPAPVCGDWSDGFRSTKDVRKDAKARVLKTCRALGGSRQACAVMGAMVSRESSGDPCAVHRLGEGEYGLGVLGLSCRWHRNKWDGDCEQFRKPEVSAVVVMRIFRRAVSRHGATSWADVNEVFGTGKNGERPAARNVFCHRLKRRGLDCQDDPRGQLGTLLGIGPVVGQERVLEEMSDG